MNWLAGTCRCEPLGRTTNRPGFGAGSRDWWLLKLDPAGVVQWQKTYGGTGNDVITSIQQTSDDGFIVAGGTMSFGAGGEDIWLVKLDSTGVITWQKTYGEK